MAEVSNSRKYIDIEVTLGTGNRTWIVEQRNTDTGAFSPREKQEGKTMRPSFWTRNLDFEYFVLAVYHRGGRMIGLTGAYLSLMIQVDWHPAEGSSSSFYDLQEPGRGSS